jgi:hypothetical protein
MGSDDVLHEISWALCRELTLATQEAKYVSEMFVIYMSFEVGSGINLGRTELALPEVKFRIIDAVIRFGVFCQRWDFPPSFAWFSSSCSSSYMVANACSQPFELSSILSTGLFDMSNATGLLSALRPNVCCC